MSIFEYTEYKLFVRARIASMPKGGHGEFQRLAAELRMHPTRISHIFKGEIDLTLEQGAHLCRYWGLSQLESEYFILLLQISRAGTKELKTLLKTQADEIRSRAKKIVNRVPRDRILSESEKALFYSNWFYSGIRLFCSVSEYQTLDSISDYFGFSREQTREVLDFLVSTGLCVETDGVYSMGAKRTHLESTSLLISRHHANWRLKAIASHENLSDRELSYTLPVSISKKDQAVLRELLIQTITKFQAAVTASEPPEMVACLNIDWFEF
jgi:uncharacterized protein (TIGR02147 family)